MFINQERNCGELGKEEITQLLLGFIDYDDYSYIKLRT